MGDGADDLMEREMGLWGLGGGMAYRYLHDPELIALRKRKLRTRHAIEDRSTADRLLGGEDEYMPNTDSILRKRRKGERADPDAYVESIHKRTEIAATMLGGEVMIRNEDGAPMAVVPIDEDSVGIVYFGSSQTWRTLWPLESEGPVKHSFGTLEEVYEYVEKLRD